VISREGRFIVAASQEFLLEALWYLLQKNHDMPGVLLGHIVSVLVDLRNRSNEQAELEKNFVSTQKEIVDVPDIVEEFFGTKHFDVYKSDII